MALFNKRFGLYQIKFEPPPDLAYDGCLSFDNEQEIEEHIKNEKVLVGDAWVIMEADPMNISKYKFIRIEPIKKL